MRTDEQKLHDRINLPRLMSRLELSVQEQDQSKNLHTRDSWLNAQAVLQHIRHARRLLRHVELDNPDPTPAQERRYQHYATTLQHLQDYMHQVEQQSTPPVRRPKPLLQSIRPPPPKPTPREPAESSSPPEDTLIPAETVATTVTEDAPPPDVQNLLPASPSVPSPEAEEASPSHTLLALPGSLAPPSSSSITATPTILQNSHALHEQLSEQLALMATQLRRNATHFSASLEKDKSVIETMQEKVEGNYDVMKRERVRLRDFRGKSGSTTCLVMMSVVVVLIAFIIMVFIIRLT